jgi:hypothetical protein
MAEVDTSSYPKPQQTNFLDTAGKYQGLAQGAVTLNAQKLQLMNGQWQTLASELSTMANDPNVTKEQAAGRLTSFAKMANIPQPMIDKELAELQNSPDVTSWAKTNLVRGQSAMDRVNLLYGQQSYVQTGQGIHPVLQGPMVGVKQNGPTIPVQPPPTAEVVDQNSGQKRMLGTQPEPNVLPPSPSGNYNPAPTNKLGGAVQAPQTSGPTGPATSMSPMWETGRQQFVAAQQKAAEKVNGLQPLKLAMPMLETLNSGPTTGEFTNLVATLKANNILPTNINGDDPTVVRQEVNKYLNQYISRNGSRSDKEEALKEQSNPNPGVQINPGLARIAKNVAAMDLMEIALPKSFKNGDYSKFGNYASTYQNGLDINAFKVPFMNDKEKAALFADMRKGVSKDKNGNLIGPANKLKFWRSLSLADKAIDPQGQ